MTSLLRRLNYFEPARLRAAGAAVVQGAAALGVTITVDDKAKTAAAAVAVLVALVQGELTRRAVTSPATADRLAVADPHAAPLKVGSGDVAP